MSSDLIAPNDLAARINAAHEEVKRALWRGAEHAIEAGRLLLQAKASVPHGQWLEWIGANCRFSERMAQIYMRLADGALESKTKRIADLTVTDAIRLLEPLRSPDESAPRSSGRRVKRNAIADAIKQDPLAILQKAWDAAGETERGMFISRNQKEIFGDRTATTIETSTAPAPGLPVDFGQKHQ